MHIFYLIVSSSQEPGYNLAGSSASGPHKASSKMLAEARFSLEASLKKDLLSSGCWQLSISCGFSE